VNSIDLILCIDSPLPKPLESLSNYSDPSSPLVPAQTLAQVVQNHDLTLRILEVMPEY